MRPRIPRSRSYALVRAWATIIQRDLQVAAVIADMYAGRPVDLHDLPGLRRGRPPLRHRASRRARHARRAGPADRAARETPRRGHRAPLRAGRPLRPRPVPGRDLPGPLRDHAGGARRRSTSTRARRSVDGNPSEALGYMGASLTEAAAGDRRPGESAAPRDPVQEHGGEVRLGGEAAPRRSGRAGGAPGGGRDGLRLPRPDHASRASPGASPWSACTSCYPGLLAAPARAPRDRLRAGALGAARRRRAGGARARTTSTRTASRATDPLAPFGPTPRATCAAPTASPTAPTSSSTAPTGTNGTRWPRSRSWSAPTAGSGESVPPVPPAPRLARRSRAGARGRGSRPPRAAPLARSSSVTASTASPRARGTRRSPAAQHPPAVAGADGQP